MRQRKRTRRLRSNQGISLIETLVALTLFAIVAAGVAAATVGSTRSNYTSKMATAAASLVNDKIEELRSLDPNANPADLTEGNHADGNNPIDETGANGGEFTRNWVITYDTPSKGLARVVVTVAWQHPIGKTVTGVTFVCQNRECS